MRTRLHDPRKNTWGERGLTARLRNPARLQSRSCTATGQRKSQRLKPWIFRKSLIPVSAAGRVASPEATDLLAKHEQSLKT